MTQEYKRKKTKQSKFLTTKRMESNQTVNEPEEMVYGIHAVSEILKTNRQINKFFYQKGLVNRSISHIIELVKQHGVIYQEVPKQKLDELTQHANHQGVVVTIPPYAYQTLDDCFALAQSRDESPFLLILDGIEDPHNLGSILRTADASGVHGVIIPKRRSASLTSVVAKVSTGAIEHVPVVRVTNLVQTMEQLQEKGVWLFAADMDGEDMRAWNSQGAVGIVIGNEGSGVSKLVKQKVDGVISIPMTGHVQSLNASVAASILMYEVARHRIPTV